jgi:hypothetical protein
VFLLIAIFTALFLLTVLLLPVRDWRVSRDTFRGDTAPSQTAHKSPAGAASETDPDFARKAGEFSERGKLALPAINFLPNEAKIERPSPALRRHLELVRDYLNARGAGTGPSDGGDSAGPYYSGDGPGQDRLLVIGHTDHQGSREHNLSLSLKRARAVCDLLEREYGVPAGLMRAVGRGFSEPVADDATLDARRKNRRVEIQVEARRA